MTPEVISFTPTWQVITFRDYQHAKVVLLAKYHDTIVCDATELSRKYTLDQLHHMVTTTLRLDTHARPTRDMLAMEDRNTLAQQLWPMLVTMGRNTRNTAFNAKVRDAVLPTHVTYFSDYVPGEDPVLDLSYIRLPPQARVLVDMLVDQVQPMSKCGGVPEFVFIQMVEKLKTDGVLVTKQEATHIWNYYERKLIACGFVDIKRPHNTKK